MTALFVFIHVLGVVLWLGAGMASMVTRVAGRREAPESVGVITRIQAAITTRLIGPGAFLVVISGVVLTVWRYPGTAMATASRWLFVMQGAGFVGALLVLLIQVPTAVKLARTPALGDTAPLFLQLRKRQAIISSIAGALALVALAASALV